MNKNQIKKLAAVLLLLLGIVPVWGQGPVSDNQNYIMSRTYLAPLTTAPSSLSLDQAMIDISYLDGLGRPLQEVLVKASPDGGKDIVVPISYDAFGRQDKGYLPYATVTGTGGAFKTGAIAAQGSYYSSTPPIGQVANSKPFSVMVFEASPLNRVQEQGFPGQVWQPATSRTATSGHTVVTAWTVNNITAFSDLANTRRVALYGVSLASNGTATLTLNGAYAAGQLQVTVTKDENWVSASGFAARLGTTEEYMDKQGRVVLKRSFNKNGTADEILSTYYVYDDFGSLSFVLPPGIGPDRTTVPTVAELNNFAYRYRYDQQNRLVEKQLPGKDIEYLVYNNLDQLVASQDANQRVVKEWFVNKYDGLGRMVLNGIWTNGGTSISRDAVQALVNSQVAGNVWEEYTGTGTGYTNRSWPTSGIITTLALNYYDTYSIPSLPATYKPATGQSTMIRGMLTASLTKVLGSTGSSNMLWNVMHYDNKGLVVKQFNQHYKGGTVSAGNYDEISNEYTFSGQPARSTKKHFTGSTAGTLAVTVLTEYEYDHRNRLTDTRKKIDAGTMITISRNVYNEIGQLRSKNLHSSNGLTFAQSINYAYNPRGWLKESSSALFKQYLKYEDVISGVVSQYNGNISYQQWQHGTTTQQSYTYTYDKLNRLLQGTMPNSIGKELLTYDKMGNIVSLSRTGTSSTVLDALNYSYSGNRLTKVVDGSSNATLEYYLTGTTNYTYDANGNIKSRLNSAQPGNNITAVTYNHLNLPSAVTATKGNAAYSYDAGGRKLRSTQGTIVTDYIDGIEWQDGVLNLVHMEEGRIVKSGTTYTYEYFLQDHLGNNRSGFKQASPSTASFRSDYYPYGLQYQQNIIVGSPKNKYLYNGKELQDGTRMLDYGARLYDPTIGRWNMIDPMAEMYDDISPYNYALSDPVGKFDPNGMFTETVNYHVAPHADDGNEYIVSVMDDIDKDKRKKKKENKEPSLGKQFVDNTPIIGPSLASGEKLMQGDYTGAAIDFTYAVFDAFTLGAFSIPAKLARTAGLGGLGLIKSANASTNVVEQVAVHGNSLKSLKPTWGYKLYSTDGTFLKNGITSKLIPETRYTKTFMQGKYMEAIPFPNRAAAYQWEFQQNQILRGPLNLNMH